MTLRTEKYYLFKQKKKIIFFHCMFSFTKIECRIIPMIRYWCETRHKKKNAFAVTLIIKRNRHEWLSTKRLFSRCRFGDLTICQSEIASINCLFHCCNSMELTKVKKNFILLRNTQWKGQKKNHNFVSCNELDLHASFNHSSIATYLSQTNEKLIFTRPRAVVFMFIE